MGQNNWWVQIVIVLIFFGFSALKVIFGKLQQQAAQRKIEQELERRRLESFRTGKPVEAVPGPQDPRRVGPTPEQLQELARRRAAQLEELRRIQATQRQQAGARVPGQARETITRIPGSAGPTVPGTRAPDRQPARQSNRKPEPARRQKPGGPPPQVRRAPEPVQPVFQSATRSLPKEPAPPTVSQVRGAIGTPVFSGKIGVNDLRRAVITAEILGRPVSERS